MPAPLRPAPAVVEVDGHRVGLTTTGSGEPLVLLHGIGRDRTDWSAVVPALAERFTVYAIDIEGFGESEPWGDGVTLGSMARMVRRTIEAAGETRPLLLAGNSMGGAVALRIVADDPASIARVVLLSPAGFGREAALGLRLLTVPVLGPVLLALDSSPLALALRLAVVDRTPEARASAVAAQRRMRRPAIRRQYLQVVHDLGAWGGIHEAWRAEVLEAVAAADVPLLVLWGDRDVVLPHAHLDSVVGAVPQAQARSLPGIGHMPQVEAPEETADAMAEFLLAC